MNMSYDEINRIKQYNLPRLMLEYGIKCASSQNGSHSFYCPFHNDSKPSLKVNLKGTKWLWHCFGCNLGGNVISFVMRYEKLSMSEACHKLRQVILPNSEQQAPKAKDESSVKEMPNYQSLLARIVEFYHDTFKEDRRGLDYLIKRGITEQSIYLDFKLGFVNGTLQKTLPADGPIVESLKNIGILNQKSNEFFYGCVVFPIFDQDDQVLSLYGRNISQRRHLYLPGPHQGVFNSKVLGTTKKIFLTESIIDCLSLYQLGLRETISLYGTGGLTQDHLELFQKHRIQQAYFCLDHDPAGDQAVQKIAQRLTLLGISSAKITLPDKVKDLNDYLLSGAKKEDFTRLIAASEPIATKQSSLFSNQVKVTEDEVQITFDFASRSYRVRGLNVSRLDQLKVNIKLTTPSAYHLDTFDLYSAKQRQTFIAQAKKVLNLDLAILNQDLSCIVEHLENLQAKMLEQKAKTKDTAPQMTEGEEQQALEFLSSADLLERISSDFKTCGYVGEENNLLLGYLVSVSRKLSSPLAVLAVSRSAAGKSTLQEAVLEFTPPEDYEKYTRLTDQALFYKEKDALRYKLLAIEEEKGAQGAGYSLRNLQSAGGLRSATTIKDPQTGQLKTDVYTVSGPTAIMVTTTAQDGFDFETYNRFIILTVDESITQTRLILERQRLNESIEGIILKRRRQRIRTLHHNAQRLLKPLEVANPYSKQLTFTPALLRARRDQPKYLTIIKVVALLRQYQKEIKSYQEADRLFEYIEVDLKDIAIANRIANQILGRSLDEMSPPARRLLTEVKRLVDKVCACEKIPQDRSIISRRDIREFSGWSDYQVRTHIKELEELEYLIPVCGAKGKRFTYQLVWDGQGQDGSRFLLGLIDVESLKTTRPK